jgi:hypothetical protein
MTKTLFAGLAIVLWASFSAPAAVAQQTPHPAPNPDALVQQDFKERVDKYVELHNQAAKDIPLKPTKNPVEIKVAQDALAERIRSARADARPGDIFSPEIRARFRELLAPTLKGEDGRDAKAIVKDDAPPSISYKVNARYPEGAALPTVPAKLLLNLPPLPKQVEYRIIDKHLILRDVDANIIVDYIPNAIR